MLALKRLEQISQKRQRTAHAPGAPNASTSTAAVVVPQPARSSPTPKGVPISPRRNHDTSIFPWEFSPADLARFPALRKRNFFCIQRHQARALHYDLRLQLDGGTTSWALPRGLIGMDKKAESSHMAVETTVHPISYSVHEGSDGTVFKTTGRRAGTLLWDIGEYEIDDSSDSEDERKSKRRRVEGGEDEDPLGWHEEAKLRDRLKRAIPSNKQRTIRLKLKHGRKMDNNTFILVLDIHNSRSLTYTRDGGEKKTWFVRLPKGVDAIPWDREGEDGDFWGRSVKTGRTFAEVCASAPNRPVMFESESARYEGWSEAKGDAAWEDALSYSTKIVQTPKS